MATSPRRAILSAGLGRYAGLDQSASAHFGPDAGNATRALLQTSLDQADKAGFDVVTVDINPQDIEHSLSRLGQAFKSRHWDAVNFGYGLRGLKHNTILFERLLNLCISSQSGIKIIFSNAPDDLFAAIQRNFAEAEV